MNSKFFSTMLVCATLLLQACATVSSTINNPSPTTEGCRMGIFDTRQCLTVISNVPGDVASYGVVSIGGNDVGRVTRERPLNVSVRNQPTRCFRQWNGRNNVQVCVLESFTLVAYVRWYKGNEFVGTTSPQQIQIPGGENPFPPDPWVITCVPTSGERYCY